jgi:flagellin
MSVSSISLSASTRANLSALQGTTQLLDQTQEQLATGKSVNSAADNATAYFASQGFLNRANDLTNVKNSLSTALQTATSVNQSITDVSTIVTQLQGYVTSATSTTDTTQRAGLASQFNALLTQLDQLVNDATFNGTNLLNSTSSQLIVYFNETNTTQLTIQGVNITSHGLGISAATGNFSDATTINTAGSLLLTALSTLRTDASAFGGNATLIQTRQDFTSNLINSLQTASDNLVLADTNQEGADLQALQAQDQLGITSLGISGQLAQAILRILE